MSRLDRLELVVRNLADRILGEEITFDQIAEQEASEQGVTLAPPADGGRMDQLHARIEALEGRPSVPGDLAPILARLDDLEAKLRPLAELTMEKDAKIASLAKHLMAQEASIQTLLQAAADADRGLNFILDNGIARQ